jgi:RNA 3'-terminal phosphate cyclase (ATP)
MLELDGAAGGGQLLRTALSLSAVTGRPFEMEAIRGDRPTPGLGAQHRACVEALATISDAEVGAGEDADEDPEVGSERLVFEPGAVEGGTYAVDVGTAGSVALLFDAVLPVATALEGPLSLTVAGGTDVAWSPPLDYLRHVKLPVVRRLGLGAAVEVHRRGFYPEGGGAVTLHLHPSSLSPVWATDRDPADVARVYSVASADLADAGVADRQAAAATGLLEEAGLEVAERAATYGETRSSGSAVVVALGGGPAGPLPAGASALGERGVPAEDIAREAVEDAREFREGPGAVDEHLADQLVPYLALSGGRVAVPCVTDHVATCVDLVAAFGHAVTVEEREEGAVLAGD